MSAPRRELLIVAAGAAALTIALTWPLAYKIGHIGRVDNGDGRWGIWVVNWVARTLVVDPLHVFDANIFYPHKGTLAYSESNLGAGVLAIPAYWLTRNPYAAHNSAVLLGFILSATSTYYLVRRLTGDRRAALLSAVCFAFTPYIFAHSAHIQLLMTAGLPFTMLMFHRLTDDVSMRRAAGLGAALAATALFCGYYGVFAALMVAYSALVVAACRRSWLELRYWAALGIAALVAVLLVLPVFVPYLRLQREHGFSRALGESVRYSAVWSNYVASSADLHVWMLPHLPRWTDVTFPGFVALSFGLWGLVIAVRRRREVAAIYGGLGIVAYWASFGPNGGLYSVLYRLVPLFAWLRAPSRLGIVVILAVAVLAGVGASAVLSRVRRSAAVAVFLIAAAVVELRTGSNQRDVEPLDPVYGTLATLPPGPVIELPFYYLRDIFHLHTIYMLSSTHHWRPLVNGYSDHIPQDFFDNVMTLAPFPTVPAMKLLEPGKVRYAIFHMYGYNDSNRNDVLMRLKELENYFRPIYMSDTTRLYEIVGYPP